MVMDPDHPAYSDDALGETNDLERCRHGRPFMDRCEDCEIEEEEDEEYAEEYAAEIDADENDDYGYDSNDWTEG